MRRLPALFLLSATLVALASPAIAQAEGRIEVVELAGVLDRPLMRYAIDRIDQAELEQARLLVFAVDSIGAVKVAGADGLPELVRRVATAKVPVAVHIGPRRAHAGGAVAFLVAAAHVASIGPSASISSPFPADAAHPGRDFGTEEQEFSRLHAERGRNAQTNLVWPLGANASLAAGLVDMVVPSLPELFKKIQGRAVETAAGRVTLDLPERSVDVRFHQPGPIRRALHALADPALLYLLLIGTAMLAVFESFQKGFGVAGVTAVLLGACAAYGVTVLPVGLLGGTLIVLGLAAMTFDVARNELLVPTWAGLAAFTWGSLIWLPEGPLRMSPALAAAGAAGAFIFFVPVMTFVRRAAAPRSIPPEIGEALIGGSGLVRSVLNPEGFVMVSGELWRARSADGNRVRAGTQVVVSAIDGTTLIVQGAPSEN